MNDEIAEVAFSGSKFGSTDQGLWREEELPPAKVDAAFILDALEKRYGWQKASPLTREYVVLRELRVGTGYGSEAERRLDMWVMSTMPSKHFERIAVEVKVSRSDFLAELKQPAKRRMALYLSNRFYFAAPKDMIRPEELPVECGLIEVDGHGKTHIKVEALWRDGFAPTWRFVASLMRRA